MDFGEGFLVMLPYFLQAAVMAVVGISMPVNMLVRR